MILQLMMSARTVICVGNGNNELCVSIWRASRCALMRLTILENTLVSGVSTERLET